MKRLLRQIICLGLAVLLSVGCSGVQAETAIPSPSLPTPTTTSILVSATEQTNEGKRVLFVLHQQFEEQEYSRPYAILKDKGVAITIASSSLSVLVGHLGMEVQPDLKLKDARAADYDAIVFIDGYGYKRYDPEAQRVAQEAAAEGKLLAAICVAPITLAKAGVIDGKRVTASTGVSQLGQAGGIFTGTAVERDGLIITANGPGASSQFGQAIAAALEE